MLDFHAAGNGNDRAIINGKQSAKVKYETAILLFFAKLYGIFA